MAVTDELSILEVQLRASLHGLRQEYSRRLRALIAQRAAETRPIRIVPKRASGAVICMTCRERMVDGSGELHRGECGRCRGHTRGTISAEPIRPYGEPPTAA